MNKIIIFTKTDKHGFYPTTSCNTDKELNVILELYALVGMFPRSHTIHENGTEEYFLQ